MSLTDEKGEITNIRGKNSGNYNDPIPSTTPTAPQNSEDTFQQNSTVYQNNSFSTNGAYPKIKATHSNGVNTYENGGSNQYVDTALQSTSEVSNKQIDCQPENGGCCSGVIPRVPIQKKHVDYDRNSSSEDEECCIYTYKGGDSSQMADLPSSFFRLDFVPSRTNGNSRNSSPDMDYLEMDFDPGPSNGQDSTSDSESSDMFVPENLQPLHVECQQMEPEIDTTSPSPLSTPSPAELHQPCSSAVSAPRSPPSPPRQMSVPDIDNSFLQPTFCYCVANKLSPMSTDENFNEGDIGTMVWKEQEAKEKQVSQIAVGACGATAVINVLLGLNVPVSVSSVKQHVMTRQRNNTALIPEYLFSRCHTGATHVDMIRGLHNASNDQVYARFFHLFPPRNISLTGWLSHWIRKGAVPIMIRNLQRGVQPGTEVPDMWHHQMVYGVSGQGVHLTNPLEVQSEAQLWPQISSPSVLKVRQEDVLSRWTPDTSLIELGHPSLPLWRKLNVLGQVVSVVREGSLCRQQHITIPASYCSGVILAMLRSNPAYEELRLCPDLPVDSIYR